MAVSLKVDPDVLITKSGEINNKKTDIQRLLEEAKSQVKNLPSTWEGEASQALQAQFNQTYDDMDKILAIITEHVEDLNTIGESFKTTTQNIQSEIESLPTDGVN